MEKTRSLTWCVAFSLAFLVGSHIRERLKINHNQSMRSQATDCMGSNARISLKAEVSISTLPLNDVPVVYSDEVELFVDHEVCMGTPSEPQEQLLSIVLHDFVSEYSGTSWHQLDLLVAGNNCIAGQRC